MSFNGWLQIAIYAVLVILITKPFGGYMTRVFNGERTPLRLVLRPIEVGIYKLCGVVEDEEQHWISYAVAMLAFSLVGVVITYAIQAAERSAVQPGSSGCRVSHLAFKPRSVS